ncbi:MAG TPA: response regulator [Acetobacteraceae bacterium]|nr:response regulator [Acetobacteraceae bacterium]
MHNPLIAIVDDDEAVCIGMTSLMRSLGYEVHAYASAKDFLQSQERRVTSCLISDVQMPGVGGLELQQILQAEGSPVPIIFITAFPDARVEQLAMQGGATCFLSKPFDGETLIHCLETALGGERAP